jgi:hypothetical protein
MRDSGGHLPHGGQPVRRHYPFVQSLGIGQILEKNNNTPQDLIVTPENR